MSRAARIIEAIFHHYFSPGDTWVEFERQDIIDAADAVGLGRPGNLGGVIYRMRYDEMMPESVAELAPPGLEWVIRGRGSARYAFSVVEQAWFVPTPGVRAVEIPDGTPGLVERHRLDDEQALLSRIRHNSLVTLATGLAVHSLQTHVRSSVRNYGQVELDELYVGLAGNGEEWVLPVEAKAGAGNVSLIQVEQGSDFCAEKFPYLPRIPLGAQLVSDDIVIFVFEPIGPGAPAGTPVQLAREDRYRLF